MREERLFPIVMLIELKSLDNTISKELFCGILDHMEGNPFL